jgi:hypothetical protein
LCKENWILGEENWILGEGNLDIGEGKLKIPKTFSSYLAIFEIRFSYVIGSMFGSMCVHGFLIWK